jgi:hypothetical protein
MAFYCYFIILIDKLVLTAGDERAIGGWRFKFHQVDFHISAIVSFCSCVAQLKKTKNKFFSFLDIFTYFVF